MGQQTVAVHSSHPLMRKLTQGFRSRDNFLIIVPLQRGLYPRRPTIRDKTTAQYKGTLTGALGEEEEIINSTANARGENPTEFIYKDICQLPDPEWIQVPRGTIKGNLVQRGLYIDAFRLDKNWSEARLYSELALLFKETLECPGENDIGLVIMMDLYSIVQK